MTSDVSPESQPPLDPREESLRLLEFHLVRQRLAGYTTFPLARELALELAPSYRADQVESWHRETAEARRLLETGVHLDMGEAGDARPVLQRASLGGGLSGEELCQVNGNLRAMRGVREVLSRRRESTILRAVAEDLPVLLTLENRLDRSIGAAGDVLDTASPALRELRVESRSAHQSLMDSMERVMRRTQRLGILQEPIITERQGRMVLLLKAEMKGRLPGIVHDVSDSGASLFVEPMSVVGLGNQWRELRLAEEREVERVLRDLSADVESVSDDLLRGVEVLGQLDLAMAKARYASAVSASPPTIVETEPQYLRLVDARHPLLGRDAVPITVEIGGDGRVLVITGPNAGGKTVALKTAGVLTLMAQAGLHVPARDATLSLFDGVYCDIGDQQSIERSLSTFSSHIRNLKAILDMVTSRSLVLIDELGTSTDPEEGSALAKAVLSHFRDRGVTVAVTTHQRDVAGFAQEQPGMANASVELDPVSLDPTYRLTMGLPGRSYALTIASRHGLDQSIVAEARSRLAPAHRSSETLLRELQEERHLAEEVRREAEQALAQAAERSVELDEELARLRDGEAAMMEEARHLLQRRVNEVNRRLRDAERAAERARQRPPPMMLPPVASRDVGEAPEPERAVAEEPAVAAEDGSPEAEPSEAISAARDELAEVREELDSREWTPPSSRRGDWLQELRSGDRVYLKGVPQPVEVITPPDDDGSVEVLLGTMRARLPVYQIDRPAHAYVTLTGDGVFYTRAARRPAVSPELDLRGERVEDAIGRVEEYLNDAAMAGLSRVRIAHGMGTGALRSAIREHLYNHPLVKSFGRDDTRASDGATMVEL